MALLSFQDSTLVPSSFSPLDSLDPGELPWLLAHFQPLFSPSWLWLGWRGQKHRGRPAWPAPLLFSLVLLRWDGEGMSRLASLKQARHNLQWRAALRLPLDKAPPCERTLRDFEAFLKARHPLNDLPRYLVLHEYFVRTCLSAGIGTDKPLFGTDSTYMWCYGALKDTLCLLGDGLVRLGRLWANATRTTVEAVASAWELPLLLAKSVKGYFRIDWKDPAARALVLEALAKQVLESVTFVRQHLEAARRSLRKALRKTCRNLLRVLTDDLETDKEGRLVLAKRVAERRLLSLTDPEARHGHKTDKETFEGFKLHVLGDVVSGLLLSLCVTEGNQHDNAVAHRLIRRAKRLYEEMDEVLGDTAYGSARLRYLVLGSEGVSLLAPPVPDGHPKSKLGKKDFQVDFEAKRATCPRGISTSDLRYVWSKDEGVQVRRFVWPGEVCKKCPLRPDCCGKRPGGKRLTLNAYEEELREAREEWKKPERKEKYRLRSQCERLVNQLTRHGGRAARAWGLSAAQLQAHSIAMACNLKLLAKALYEQMSQKKAQAA